MPAGEPRPTGFPDYAETMRVTEAGHPRIFCIPASRAPVAAVLRRGPSAWFQLGKWEIEKARYEPGGWLKASLYPQRCDLSPDGRWFCYVTLKGSAKWKVGRTYVAVSRLPWFAALAAWSTDGTWTRGVHFVDDAGVWQVSEPNEGNVAPCRGVFGIAVSPATTFAVERRRGWSEAPGSPAQARDDIWDLRRAGELWMEKARPGSAGVVRLRVHGEFAAFRSGSGGRDRQVCYELVEDGRATPLEDAQWADWHADGRLLVATIDGRLQIREFSHSALVEWELDLRPFSPDPSPPPRDALRW